MSKSVSLSDVPLMPVKQGAGDKTVANKKDVENQNSEVGTVGVWDGVLTIVSMMIGSGIFTSVGTIQKSATSSGWAFVTWIFAAVISICGAFTYAELGAALPQSGGESLYLARGLGQWASFTFDVAALYVMRPLGMFASLYSFAEHLVMGYFLIKTGDITPLKKGDLSVRIAAVIAAIVVGLIGSASYRVANSVQASLTYVKVVALVLISIAGFYNLIKSRTILSDNFNDAFTIAVNKGEQLGLFEKVKRVVLAMNGAMWSLDGWNNLNMIAGKVNNPGKTLPLSIMTAIPSVTGIYMFVILSYYTTLEKTKISDSVTGLHFGRAISANYGGPVIALLVMLSTFSSALSGLLTTIEVANEAYEKGLAPKFLTYVNKSTGSAFYCNAMMVLFGSVIGFLSARNYDAVLTVCSQPIWLFYALTMIAMLNLRVREADLVRPFRVWIIAPVVFFAGCILMIVASLIDEDQQVMSGFSMLAIALIIAVYFIIGIFKKPAAKKTEELQASD